MPSLPAAPVVPPGASQVDRRTQRSFSQQNPADGQGHGAPSTITPETHAALATHKPKKMKTRFIPSTLDPR
jgi:hypothetical protein